MLISERCRSINPSKTLVIAEQAEALRAEGKDIIFMNAGQPDFDTPLHIKAAAMEGMLAEQLSPARSGLVVGNRSAELDRSFKTSFRKPDGLSPQSESTPLALTM